MASEEIIRLSEPVLGEREKRALAEVIDSEWITSGPRVAEFESTFATLHNQRQAVAVSSCTAGLHLALAALGVGPGDEVLVPSLTFVATVNVVLYAGATPVFVDLDSVERPHVSLADATAKLSPRGKAVIVMHYGGYPVDLAAWRAFCDQHSLALVEDAAHAPGLPGIGSGGDISVFSFFGNKNMTTAEGGMVLARDEALLDQIRRLRSHALTTTTLDREHGHAFAYDVVGLGYNYRMDELRAAVGLAQLPLLAGWNERRRQLATLYRELLGQRLPAVTVAFEAGEPTSAHLLAVVLPSGTDRAELMRTLRNAGVQTSIHYPCAHLFSYHGRRFPGLSLPVSEEFSRRELSLPLHPRLTEAQVERVVDELARALGGVAAPTPV